MRLNKIEIEAIKKVAQTIFGNESRVILYGSRTDDSKRGGDIDLYIQCSPNIAEAEKYQLKIKFLVQLKKIIGDQKIDVLIGSGKQSNNFLSTVKKEGIQL
jgi:hypothetical protein